jgi:hypothetical protein
MEWAVVLAPLTRCDHPGVLLGNHQLRMKSQVRISVLAAPDWQHATPKHAACDEYLSRRHTDRVLDAACLQRLVDLRLRQGRVSPERILLTLGLLAPRDPLVP